MTAYIGQVAALATSFLWSATSLLFTSAGERVGSVVVNRIRLLMALVFVTIMHTLLQGQVIPLGAEPFRWGWLALSGAIGFVVGDGFLFQAYLYIGPRLTMLLMALAPVFSTVLGWVLLHERLSVMELVGILLTVGGTALVIADRPTDENHVPRERPKQFGLGILFGLGAALGQAVGLLTSKEGLVGDFPALSGVLMRLIAAAILIWTITLLQGKARPTFQAIRRQPKAGYAIGAAAFLGPTLGVWFSLIAVQKAPLGIASTLTSLSPIILLPVSRVLYREQIGPAAIVGTIVAVTGTALLFL